MFSREADAKVCGPAVTVQMIHESDKSAPKLEKHFVDHNRAGFIMYIQQPKGLPSACWGGLMSTRAKHLGAQAAVIDGRMRDVNEHKDMGFPVCGGFLGVFFPAYLLTTRKGLCERAVHTGFKLIYESVQG